MRQRFLGYLLVSILTCLALIGISAPSFSLNSAVNTEISPINSPLYDLPLNLAEINSLLSVQSVAQAGAPDSGKSKFISYSATLEGSSIFPSPVNTSAFGEVGAVLIGDRLVVRGGFRNLSSQLRDYATDPLSPPNPNITSGIHLHRGATNENGPFQFALKVSLDPGLLSGTFSGDLTLNQEQIQAFTSGKMYVDLHTKGNRAGELRGLLKPA